MIGSAIQVTGKLVCNPGSMNIPFFGIKRQYQTLKDEILDAVNDVYSSGQVLDGPFVEEFEMQIAGRCHREYAVAVNSCTQGLIFAQTALGINQQSIITPTVSFAATLNSVLLANNLPAYCDVDKHGLINLESLGYNPKSRKIHSMVYVNLFGNIIDYDKLKVINNVFNDNELTVIEDAAQSFGAYYKGIPSGKLGDVSVLSFDPTKNLPNYGSGGMLLTDDWEVYRAAKNLRDNGKEDDHNIAGTNSKMSEADCASMLVKLKHFDTWQKRRTEIAEFYTDNLKNYVRVTEVSPDVDHAWHKFPIWFDDSAEIMKGFHTFPVRHSIKQYLSVNGIETKIHYGATLPDLPVNAVMEFPEFPIANKHTRTELSLPIYPELTDLEVEYVVEQVIEGIFAEIDR